MSVQESNDVTQTRLWLLSLECFNQQVKLSIAQTSTDGGDYVISYTDSTWTDGSSMYLQALTAWFVDGYPLPPSKTHVWDFAGSSRPTCMYDIYDFRNSDSCILSANEKLRWFLLNTNVQVTDLFFISLRPPKGEIPIAKKICTIVEPQQWELVSQFLPRYPPRLQAMVSHQDGTASIWNKSWKGSQSSWQSICNARE